MINYMFFILFLVTLVSVVGIIMKINAQQKCPSDSALRQVVLGRKKFNDTVADRIIAHLGICKECQKRVDQMNRGVAE